MYYVSTKGGGRGSVFETHTAGSDTIFVQIYMDPTPGVPGVSKDAPASINSKV